MPKVGDKEFPYTNEGYKQAAQESSETGIPISDGAARNVTEYAGGGKTGYSQIGQEYEEGGKVGFKEKRRKIKQVYKMKEDRMSGLRHLKKEGNVSKESAKKYRRKTKKRARADVKSIKKTGKTTAQIALEEALKK